MSFRTQTPYIDAVRDFCSRYPDLYKLSDFLQEQQGRLAYPSRAAVLQFGSSTSSRVEKFDFRDVDDLKTYFSHTARSTCKYRLYLMEDLSRPFIEAFGSHFWMDPFLFAAHENSTHWTSSAHDYALPRRLIPSANHDPLFTLRYYEVVRVNNGDKRPKKIRTASNVGRKIEAGGKKKDSDVFVIRRNASFWSRDRENGGWDG